MKNHSNKFLVLLVIGVLFLSGCSKDDPGKETPVASPLTLVSAEELLTWSVGDLKGFMSTAGVDIDLDAIKYSVSIYEVNYKTDYKGDSVTVSGLVFIPDTDETVSTVSFQHGTVANDAGVPTNLGLGNGQNLLLSTLSSMGMVTVASDFIGFGSSVNIMHPYYVEDLTATTVMNGVYASRQVAELAGVSVDNELYLAGYSQGGYATMTAHKYCEVNEVPFYELKASFAASGGYDIKGFQEYFFGLESYENPFFLAYVAYAYIVSFDVGDLTDYFNEPYASAIPEYFDGSMNGEEINDQLTDVIADLVNNDLLENIDTKDEYAYIREAFEDNSPIDFVPQIPLHMYHGNADITVPYQNSVDVYNQFISNGASEDVVTFTTMEGATHGTGVLPYIIDLADQLMNLEE